MNVRIKKRKSDFTQIQNSALHNASIPLDTLGLFCYLLAHPDNWTANMTSIRKERRIGKDKLQRMFRDLEDCGHARLVTDQDKRTGELLGKHWNVSEEPIYPVHRQPSYTSVGKPDHRQPGNPTVGKGGSDNNSPFLTAEYEPANLAEARRRIRMSMPEFRAQMEEFKRRTGAGGDGIGEVGTVPSDVLETDGRYADPREAGLPSSSNIDTSPKLRPKTSQSPPRGERSTVPPSTGSNLDQFLEPEDYECMRPKTRKPRPKVQIPKEPIDPRITEFAESVARLSYGPSRPRRKFGRGGRR